ncbi:polysaccharide biosynthesis C-terminal domain-containing protein, partial [Oleiphilus sp. HI0132]
ILSVGQLINSYFGPSGYLASMTGNQDQLTKALLASGAIAIVSYIIFIPLLGIEGAALSSMLGTISWNILIYLKMSRLEGLRSKAF